MSGSVVLAGAVRTPLASFCGAFSGVSATELGSISVKATLERAGISPGDVDEVIIGNVIGAGLGQNVARQVSMGANMGPFVTATTVNKVCGSGLKSVMLARQAILCEDSSVVIAGGTENMSRAPYLLERARTGYRMGNGEVVDSLIKDGLWDVYHNTHMGNFGDKCGGKYGFSREDQDNYAAESYRRAVNSQTQGYFAREIVPVEVPQRNGNLIVNEDDEPKRFNEEKMRSLRPAFHQDGAITAGNASSVNDGAASVAVMSEERAAELGVKPQARIIGHASAAHEPEWFTTAPVEAIDRLMKALSLTVNDVDLYEINEAFSVVPMAAMKDLGIPRDKTNVLGGAVALGHPLGASGTRTLVTLINALEIFDGRVGIVSLCIGGGEAVAMAVERIP